MNWLDKYFDRLTKRQTRRQMQDSVGLFLFIGIVTTITIFAEPVDHPYPESQPIHLIAFWADCIGAVVSFLTVITNGLALYRNRNGKSVTELTS